MSDRIVRFGILGCGTIARFHADAIAHLENAALIGVADANITLAEKFAEQYAVKAYPDFNAMLEDATIDAVCICTPSGFHVENALEALKAKKHVVLEKPMAFTKMQAKLLEAEVQHSGCVLTVISQLRFSEDIRRVKALLEQDAFGKLVFCDLYMKYWRDPAYYAASHWKGTRRFDGGGALMNQGIHGVDLLLYLAGNAKVLCARNQTRHHNIEVEDSSVAMLEFENGAMGVIEAATCAYPGFERRLEITGTEGSVVLLENKIDKLIIGSQIHVDGVKNSLPGTASDPTAMGSELHALQISNFINAICGKEPLVMTAAEGSRAVSLIEDIYKYN